MLATMRGLVCFHLTEHLQQGLRQILSTGAGQFQL